MFIKSLTLHEWYRGHSYRFRFSPSSGRHGRPVVAWYGTTPSQITLWTCGGTCAFITAHPLRSWRGAHGTKLCIINTSRWMSIMLGLGSWFKSQSMAQNRLRKTINVLFLHFAKSIHENQRVFSGQNPVWKTLTVLLRNLKSRYNNHGRQSSVRVTLI